jgi:hypothetical protein
MKVAVCYTQITGTQTIVLMANGVFDSSGTTIWSPICKFYTLTHQWNLKILFHPGNPPFVILRNMTWQVLRVKQELSTLRSTWVHTRFFVGYVLLDVLFFSIFFLLVIVFLSFFDLRILITPFGIFKAFFQNIF